MAIKLRPYQNRLQSFIYDAWDEGHKNVLAVMPTGAGKCLGRGTPVLMSDGSVKMIEDIRGGDTVMGPDSKPRVVLSTCVGKGPLFRIIPIKGEPWVCNDVHVLTLKSTENQGVIDIPLDEYLLKSKTFKHIFKQFRVPVSFPHRPTWIDPYLVGLFLAEGTHGVPQITNPDMEVIHYLCQWTVRNEMKINFTHGHGCLGMTISDLKPARDKNKVKRLADSCTDKDDRWIPREFLINDEQTRLQLLAGLLDGDGYLHHGNFEIITKYESLNRDILFLARSLGFAAYSTVKKGTIKSIAFEGYYHRIIISGHTDKIPTKIARKKATPRKQKKDVLNTGFKVEPIGEGEYFGFELDGDGRFLLGDFTVTHNTKLFCTVAIWQALEPTGPRWPTAIMVHRKELVQQICLTLAEEEIKHNIIAPKPVILGIIAAQRQLLKKQFYDYNAPITVISVDTLNSRIMKHEKWAKSIRFWITDEAAHVLRENKWGRAISYFTNAIGLGVTATPQRLDKRGLGRHADGLFDTMVEGPDTRWLIKNGFLCDYRIVVPESDYNQYLKKANEGHDYSLKDLAFASAKSKIVGDAVKNYLKFAKGKQAIYFVSDVAAGERMEREFKSQGVTAKLLTSLTDDTERLKGLIAFREKKIQVLLNIDLFDEGLDVPGIEVVGMCRKTMSVSKYKQMCLDEKTEILTSRGWLKHFEINQKDKVAGFNINDGVVKWCKIQEIISREREVNEKMFTYRSTNLNFRVTSDHDMIVKSRSRTTKKWQKQTINDISLRKHCFHVPVSGVQVVKEAEITDDEIKFLGWFLSDGNRVDKGSGRSVASIAQCSNNPEYLAHIRSTLKGCNFKFSEYENKRTGKLSHYDSMIQFIIPKDKPARNFKGWDGLRGWIHLDKWMNKTIPDIYETLSERQIEILIEAMNLGDGTKRKNATWKKHTISLTCGDNVTMANKLQSLLVRRGFRCNQAIENRTHLGKKDCHMLHIRKLKTSSIAGTNDLDGHLQQKKPYKRARIVEESDYKREVVWCVRNRLGTIITRREGKVMIMGNCGRGLRLAPNKSHLIIIDHVGNVMQHGLPCRPRRWTLDRIIKRRDRTNLLRNCGNPDCNAPFDRILHECPYCGWEIPKPGKSENGGRIGPEHVDGDLYMLDAETLRAMEQSAVLEDPGSVARRVARVAGEPAGIKAMKSQLERIQTQKELVEVIAQWAGKKKADGYTDRQINKAFYLEFDKTITWALGETKAEMLETIQNIKESP